MIKIEPIHASGGLIFQPASTAKDLKRRGPIVIPGWRGKDASVPTPLCGTTRPSAQHSVGAHLPRGLCFGGWGPRPIHWRYAESFKDSPAKIPLRNA